MTVNIKISDWLSGPVTHLHFRRETDSPKKWGFDRYQFTPEAAVRYLEKLGLKKPIITDTHHALGSLNLERIEKSQKKLTREEKKQLVKSTSEFLEKRFSTYHSPQILSSVEVDIINNKGELDLTNNCLKRVRFVIASFHSFIWKIFNNRKEYFAKDILDGYQRAIKNPNIDALGHPTKLPKKLIEVMKPECFTKIIRLLPENHVAFEIEILEDFSAKRHKLTRNVIAKAIKLGVNFICSSDFHQFDNLQCLKAVSYPKETVYRTNVDSIYCQCKTVHETIKKRLLRNISLLRELGLKPRQIINSSNERFLDWFKQKN